MRLTTKMKFEMPIRVKIYDIPHAEINNMKAIEDMHGIMIVFDISNSKSVIGIFWQIIKRS
jgi:hypothetical protein